MGSTDPNLPRRNSDWMVDENPPNKVDLAINAFEALSMEEKETIAARMGMSGMAQDFHNA